MLDLEVKGCQMDSQLYCDTWRTQDSNSTPAEADDNDEDVHA